MVGSVGLEEFHVNDPVESHLHDLSHTGIVYVLPQEGCERCGHGGGLGLDIRGVQPFLVLEEELLLPFPLYVQAEEHVSRAPVEYLVHVRTLENRQLGDNRTNIEGTHLFLHGPT